MSNRIVAVVLSLAMLLVFPIVSFADVFAGTEGAAESTQTVQREESTAAESESTASGEEQAADSTEQTSSDQTAAETGSNDSTDSSSDSTVNYPRQTFEDQVNGMKVNVVAPEGTTMEVKAVASSDVKDSVEKAASEEIKDIQAVDISFHKDGKEIEPESEVTVQFSGLDLDGDQIEIFHIKDNSSSAEKVGESKSMTSASIKSDQFSVYVLTGTGQTGWDKTKAETEDTAYTMHVGDKKTIATDNFSGTWVSSDPTVVSLESSTGRTNIITAKKAGKSLITYTYNCKDAKVNPITKTDNFYVTVEETTHQVCFYILLPGKNVPADASAQPAANYYPGSGDDYYSLTGTISDETYNTIKSGKTRYYSMNGISSSLYSMDSSTSTAINTYLSSKYGADGKWEVVWYLLKNESDKYPHIDGYVKNVPATVTYHSNYDTDVTKKYTDIATGTSYTTLDYTAVGDTDAEKLPTRSGYTFKGWSTSKSDQATVTYKAGASFTLKSDTDLYAVWQDDNKYSVNYKFEAESGSLITDLPEGVTAQCPGTKTGYSDDDVVAAPTTAYNDIVQTDSRGHAIGTWSFVKWNESSQTIKSGDVTFTGYWKFTEYENIPFDVEYRDIDTNEKIDTTISGTGTDGEVIGYDYLNAHNDIHAITGYNYDSVSPTTLSRYWRSVQPTLLAADNLQNTEPNVAVVYYKKISTPPAAAKYTLTINYVDEQGNKVADSYTDSLDSGAAYSQASPVISGYKLSNSAQETVAGTMPAEDVTVSVVYTKTAVTPNDPKNPKDPTSPTTPGTVTPASDKSASTGDSWNGGFWAIILLLGAAGVTAPIVLRKKNSEED